MDISPKLFRSFSFYASTALAIFRYLVSILKSMIHISIIFAFFDMAISFLFRLHDLSPVTVDLDDETTLHFWTCNHRRFNKPNLVMIHGYGGDARWQFIHQVGGLSRHFNLFVPDLLFFGKSYSRGSERTDVFQAKSLLEGLKRLGVERFSVYSISYGGYVAYRMGEMCSEGMEKVVIVSSGVGSSEEQIAEQIKKIGRDPKEVLLPKNPGDLRLLVDLSSYKSRPLKWLPDFLLQQFINAMGNSCRKEKAELLEQLLANRGDTKLPILKQESLLIWGDKDNFFPLHMAHQLQRHLGPKSRLEIVKDTGHAANLDSPHTLNALVASFILGHS